MGRTTVEWELFAHVAQGRRAHSVRIVGPIASAGTIDKVLGLVGRGTKLIIGPRYAERDVEVHVTS